jgi:hypothetical protein
MALMQPECGTGGIRHSFAPFGREDILLAAGIIMGHLSVSVFQFILKIFNKVWIAFPKIIKKKT